jgi:hypothetical protein
MRPDAEAAAPLVRPERPAKLSELEPASFALLTIEKTSIAGDVEFPLPCCLVQLPEALPFGFNSQDQAEKKSVRWWQPHGGYAEKWTPRFEGRRRSQTEVLRVALAVANVQMWGAKTTPTSRCASFAHGCVSIGTRFVLGSEQEVPKRTVRSDGPRKSIKPNES